VSSLSSPTRCAAAWSKCPLGSSPGRLPRHLSARLAALDPAASWSITPTLTLTLTLTLTRCGQLEQLPDTLLALPMLDVVSFEDLTADLVATAPTAPLEVAPPSTSPPPPATELDASAPPRAKFCFMCGSKLPARALFCPQCGERMEPVLE
jgi:hypothetical protein